MAVAEVKVLEEEAVAAIEAGNLALAIRKLQALKVRLIALPDSGQQAHQIRWDRGAIDGLISSLRKEAGAGTGLRQTLVTYKRASEI